MFGVKKRYVSWFKRFTSLVPGDYTYVVSEDMVVSLLGLFFSCLTYTPIRGFPS